MTGRKAPKRSKQVLTSGDSFNLLTHANTRSTQIELEQYVLEPQAFGPSWACTRLPLGLTAGVLRGLERGRGNGEMESWWRESDQCGVSSATHGSKAKEFSSFSMLSVVTARNDSEQRLPPPVNGNACPGENLCRSRVSLNWKSLDPKFRDYNLVPGAKTFQFQKRSDLRRSTQLVDFHVLTNRTELECFFRLRHVGPLGSTPGFHWVQRREIPAVLQGAVAV